MAREVVTRRTCCNTGGGVLGLGQGQHKVHPNSLTTGLVSSTRTRCELSAMNQPYCVVKKNCAPAYFF